MWVNPGFDFREMRFLKSKSKEKKCSILKNEFALLRCCRKHLILVKITICVKKNPRVRDPGPTTGECTVLEVITLIPP